MTSAINPNNIDGAYPVAGQDNNSQGFRDNFTNTKTNFQYAADEISDLQSKVVLKAALTGTTLDNDMLGVSLSNAVLSDMAYYRLALGTLSGSVAINYATSMYQTLTTSGSVSLSFTNFPPAGAAGIVSVEISVANTAHTVTFPASVTTNVMGIQGLNPATNIMEFAATGTYTFQFITSDGGSSYTINQVNNILTPFNYSSEDLGPSAAVDLEVTASYFATASAETATLAAGADGQIKTLMMSSDGGDMVITVSNAGWKTSGPGTITFDAIGDACTLQYINSKWYCIGNNGVTFA
jgi:hypothetical protein